jgi:hypothetical protein
VRLPAMIIMLVGSAFALPACHKQPQPQDQNIIIDNGIDANADIEALPPDESSETPSNELVNGNDNPDVNDLNASNSH